MTTEPNQQEASEWEETDRDASQEAYEEFQKRRGQQYAVKAPEGDSSWRIMPPRKGSKGIPFTAVWIHAVKNPHNPDQFMGEFVCPSKQRGEPCSICPGVSRLKRTGVEADVDLADEVRAKEVIICNAVRLDEKKPEDIKVRPLIINSDPYKQLNTILKDRAEGCDFTHPDKGRTVIFTRTGKGKTDTKYSARLGLNASAIPRREWLTQLVDLTKVYPEADHFQMAALFGTNPPPGKDGEAATRAPSSNQVGPGDQRQLSPAADPGVGEEIDQVWDAAQDCFVPRKK